MAVWNCETRSKKKSKEDAWRQIHWISQSEAFPEDRSIGPANQKRLQKIRPDSVSSNQIILAGHTSWTHRLIDQIPFLSNQIPSDRLQTDHIPSRPIRILQMDFRTDFRRTIFRLVQSYPSDGLSDWLQTDHLPSHPIISFGRTFGRTSDGPSSVSSNHIFRTDFRTDFRRTIFCLVQSNPSECHRKKSDRSDGYQTVMHGHSLRSHPHDRTVRPSSLSRLRAKAVRCTHKPPQAHKSLTRKDVFNHTQ